MKHQFLIFAIFLTFCCISCSNEDNNTEENQDKMYFTATISDPLTKVAGQKFEGGNMVGIYVVDYSLSGVPGILDPLVNRATNRRFWQSAAGLSADIPILWGESSNVDIYSYYPYASNITDLSHYLFGIQKNQSTPTGYEMSDFLWTKVTASPQKEPIPLLFTHQMNKIVINLKSDASIPGALIGANVKILGVDTVAIINIATGVAGLSEKPAIGDILALPIKEMTDGYEMTYNAIMIPQTINAGQHFLEITTVAGHTYNYTLDRSITFPAGYLLPLNVTLKSGELLVEVGEIANWNMNNVPVVGNAEVVKPYVLGDFYNENEVQGIVFEVDITGEHGKIVSLDETQKLLWATETMTTAIGANSEIDGRLNVAKMKEMDPSLNKFPACKWCDDKNKNGITGWYLPATQELKSLHTTLKEVLGVDDYNNLIFNEKIKNAGGVIIRKNDVYHSSTEVNNASAYAFDFFGKKGSIVKWSKTTLNPDIYYIRAIYAF